MADRPDLAALVGRRAMWDGWAPSLAGTKVRRVFRRVPGRQWRGWRRLDGTASWPLDSSSRAAEAAQWLRPAAGGWRA